MEKLERVGKVVLDYQFYKGQDFYCDGDIEDDLLETVQTHEEDELEKIINEKENGSSFIISRMYVRMLLTGFQ